MRYKHVKGFKREVDKSLVNPSKIYRELEKKVYEERYLDFYGLDAHCYECHKPIKIDSRIIIKNNNMTNTNLFCDEHKKDSVKYSRDAIFLKHKNHILSVFKRAILNNSLDKIPNFKQGGK